MNDRMNHFGDEEPIGEQMKRKFSGLDQFIPPAVPFEQIEGAVRVTRAESTQLVGARRRSTGLRFRGNAGASLVLVGMACAVVLALGSGMWGPKVDSGQAGGPALATEGSLVPSVSASASPALAAGPTTVFSGHGWAASWSPSGSRFAFSPSDGSAALASDSPVLGAGSTTSGLPHTKIVDSAGREIETVPASNIMWVDDNTYLGFNFGHAFVGHVGSAAQEALPGDFGGWGVTAAGVVPLSMGQDHGNYAVWTSAGLSATRSGYPSAISRDGKLLAVTHYSAADMPTRLDIVRTDSGDVVSSYVVEAAENSIVHGFSPDGSMVAVTLSPVGGVDYLGILDVASGRVSVVDPCVAYHVVWLDNSRLLASSSDSCQAPAGSGVTITTNSASAMTVSAGGRVAVVTGHGSPTDPNGIIRVTIEGGTAGAETIDYQGLPGDDPQVLAWSADGSLLLMQYQGANNQCVVLIRP